MAREHYAGEMNDYGTPEDSDDSEWDEPGNSDFLIATHES